MKQNMNEIICVTSIKELSEYDSLLRDTCKNVINNDYYDDIVNDLYIKVDRYFKSGKKLNGGFIFMMMKSLNIDRIRKDKMTTNLINYDIIDFLLEDIDISNIIIKVDMLLNEIIPEDKEFYLYLKMNNQRLTAEKYDMKLWKVKKKSKDISNKLKPYLDRIKKSTF